MPTIHFLDKPLGSMVSAVTSTSENATLAVRTLIECADKYDGGNLHIRVESPQSPHACRRRCSQCREPLVRSDGGWTCNDCGFNESEARR